MTSYRVIPGAVVAAAVLVLGMSCGDQPDVEGDFFFSITSAGVVNGYSVIDTSLAVIDGRDVVLVEQTIESRSALLGMDVDAVVDLVFQLDPVTGRTIFQSFAADQGQSRFHGEARLVDGGVHSVSSLGPSDKVVAMPEGARLENTLLYPQVLDDLRAAGAPDRTYLVFDPGDREVQEIRYSRIGEETLELAGEDYHALTIDRRNLATGVMSRLWLDTATGVCVKIVENQGRVIQLADRSLAGKLERYVADDDILTPTNVSVADLAGLCYLKVRARLQPTGTIPTVAGLNVPGQRFTGTVDGNLIAGVFEIEHPRYDGVGAPPFPPDFGGDPAFAPYLMPGALLESDDPDIVARARELTAGSADSWEAMRRLSRWVATEIAYAIPGGGSASGVLAARAGECGGHSLLLAAFCRAVGIPARVVWGVMYMPNDGGKFGQHGWTEVYMGDAGWLPVDATADEIDFADSGHIRLGEYTSLATRAHGKEFEILDYRVIGATDAEADTGRYAIYLGEYTLEGAPEPAEVKVQDGSLVVVVPGGTALAFADPDPRGRWQCKLADHVYLTFETDGPLNVVEACIHEVHDLPRRPGPIAGDDVPAAFRPYPGTYRLTLANADFTVSYARGSLRVEDPLAHATSTLGEPDAAGWRPSSNGRHSIRFERGDDGTVTGMTIDAASSFTR